MKQCTKCLEEKPLVNFSPQRQRRDGRRGECKACAARIRRERYAAAPEPEREASRRYHAKNRDSRRATHRRWRYGLTADDTAAILAAQSGGCALASCVRLLAEEGKHAEGLRVDHDHVTGAVRGLLCNSHNAALGVFGDSPEALREAAYYLDQARQAWIDTLDAGRLP